MPKVVGDYLMEEVERLTAELAKRDALITGMKAGIDSVHAELAAERDRADEAQTMNGHRAREMLRLNRAITKLREVLEPLLVTHETVFPDREETRRARAALAETKGCGDA